MRVYFYKMWVGGSKYFQNMLTINITNVAYLVLIVYIIAVNCSEEIKQLPHCRDNDEGNVYVTST